MKRIAMKLVPMMFQDLEIDKEFSFISNEMLQDRQQTTVKSILENIKARENFPELE